jgi:hypothetical protein
MILYLVTVRSKSRALFRADIVILVGLFPNTLFGAF